MRGNAPSHPPADAVDEPASDTAAGWLSVVEAAGLLARHGIPLVRWDVCSTAPDAVVRASTYRRPVVLKAVHPELLHKTGEGGVALDLSSDGQISEAAQRLLRLRESASLLVQEQEVGVEVIVGAVRDVEFGPVVMVGMGGVDVETTDDVQLALAPVTVAEAKTMFTRLRGSAALVGPRTGAVDLDAIAAVVTALGDLITADEEITEVDLNPVLVRREGCVVVDWRIRAASSSCQDSSRTAPGEP
jgi:acetyltransferase